MEYALCEFGTKLNRGPYIHTPESEPSKEACYGTLSVVMICLRGSLDIHDELSYN